MSPRSFLWVAASAPTLLVLAADSSAQSVSLVSVDASGAWSNGDSFLAAVSADGRYVAFHSRASNLVAASTGGVGDVFLRDRVGSTTILISAALSGAGGNAMSMTPGEAPALTPDGRYVAFSSQASDLVMSDTNGRADVFVRDVLTGTTERVSLNSAGVQATRDCEQPDISADGRYVVFHSAAGNLVAGDTNGNQCQDVFLRDRQTATTTRLSVNASGIESNLPSLSPSISPDGRFVAFASLGENLVPNDTNASFDMFLFDRQTGVLERVSVSSGNVEGNNHSGYALYASTGNSVSADGRWVAFPSQASNLVAQDTNGMVDIFVRDRTLGTTKRVSVSSSGTQANNHSGVPWLSADGRWIAFGSFATNLVPGGSSSTQLLIHDRMLGTTELASADANGAQANFGAWTSALSANGRFVVFDTTSSNLVPGDLNGAWDVFLRERCGTVKSYCTAGVSTNGCAATLSSTGTPSASTGSGFTITASNVEGQKSGLLFYGINGRNDVPWGGGTSYLCVTFPVQRTATQNSGGSLNACDGVLAIDWNAYVAANPGALGNPFGFGQRVNAQVWFRDPPAPKTTNLSDGIEFTVCP